MRRGLFLLAAAFALALGLSACAEEEGAEQACRAATAAPTGTPWPTPAVKFGALARAVSAGSTKIIVVDAAGFVVGDTIHIGMVMATQESGTITAVSAETFTLDCALQFDHAPGEYVVVYEAAPPPEATPTPTLPPTWG